MTLIIIVTVTFNLPFQRHNLPHSNFLADFQWTNNLLAITVLENKTNSDIFPTRDPWMVQNKLVIVQVDYDIKSMHIL